MDTEASSRYISYFSYFAELSQDLDSFSLGYAGKGAVLQSCRLWW